MRGLTKEYQQLMSLAMQGDEESRKLCIQIEYEMSQEGLNPLCLEWAHQYAVAGDLYCRMVYMENALAGNVDDVDWQELEAWCEAMVLEKPELGYFMQACLYECDNDQIADEERMLDSLLKGYAAGSIQCGFRLAVYYWENEPEQHSAQEIRDMMEQCKDAINSAEQYSLLAEVCDAQGDLASSLSYLKRWHKEDPKDPIACLHIAWRYMQGEGIKANPENALKYYQKAANLGSDFGLYKVGAMHLAGEGCRRNVKRAVDYLQRAVQQDSAEACGVLGRMYWEGKDVSADTQKAITYLSKGAELEDAQSCLLLARLHYMGSGVEQDAEKAAQLLDTARMAAIEGDEEFAATLRSVETYATGRGMPITSATGGPITEADMQRAIENNDFAELADRLYMRLCQYPYDEELLRMARFLLHLKVMDEEQVRDYISMLRNFADEIPEVAMMLGDMYYHGDGATRNARSAMLFYQKALEFGADAEVILRIILGLHEEELKGGREEVPAWLDEVPHAEGNTAPLYYMLGLLHSVGLYVEQSVEKAAEMFHLATEQGFEADYEADLQAWQSGSKTLRDCVLPL